MEALIATGGKDKLPMPSTGVLAGVDEGHTMWESAGSRTSATSSEHGSPRAISPELNADDGHNYHSPQPPPQVTVEDVPPVEQEVDNGTVNPHTVWSSEGEASPEGEPEVVEDEEHRVWDSCSGSSVEGA
jgi:hypothetical protein